MDKQVSRVLAAAGQSMDLKAASVAGDYPMPPAPPPGFFELLRDRAGDVANATSDDGFETDDNGVGVFIPAFSPDIVVNAINFIPTGDGLADIFGTVPTVSAFSCEFVAATDACQMLSSSMKAAHSLQDGSSLILGQLSSEHCDLFSVHSIISEIDIPDAVIFPGYSNVHWAR